MKFRRSAWYPRNTAIVVVVIVVNGFRRCKEAVVKGRRHLFASGSILSFGFDTFLLRFQIKKNDPSVLWSEKSSVFWEGDGFRKFCTDCTYFHPLTARILFETLTVSTICVIAFILASLSLDNIMCGWNSFVVWSWREQIGQNSVSDRTHVSLTCILK
jgi:hypothetical protein